MSILTTRNHVNQGRIGIIAGAGPEAGIDLWQKILSANKSQMGGQFRGDLDAPDVTVFSIPRLGLAMNLAENEEALWSELKSAAQALAQRTDYICIACNVLHYFSDRIRELNLAAELVSVVDVAAAYIQSQQLEKFALVSIQAVTILDKWSPYRVLGRYGDIEVPAQPTKVNDLVADIKRFGAGHPYARAAFKSILDSLGSEVVFLACTELPLVKIEIGGKGLVDVTELLAQEVVRKSLSGRAEYQAAT
ncbi:MAG: aspartate/glutamate racemase family protein [Sulfurimicrobium sp.]|nr:aspartate/glutamate racemase family protein [Sulfurimicrobium sp.]